MPRVLVAAPPLRRFGPVLSPLLLAATLAAGDPTPPNVGSVLIAGPFDFSQVGGGTLDYDILERTDDIAPMRVCWSTTTLQVLGSDCFKVHTLDRPAYNHESIDLRDLVGRQS